jgi:tripartite-type tricarboxylate transporter receptor subunit TctC
LLPACIAPETSHGVKPTCRRNQVGLYEPFAAGQKLAATAADKAVTSAKTPAREGRNVAQDLERDIRRRAEHGKGRGGRTTNQRYRRLCAFAAALIALAAPAAIALAQSVEDFYRNRDMDLYIGYSTGGAYDFYARAIGRYMGRHIPGNPTLVPKNMEGAGSLRLANFLYRVAPHDGSTIGTIGRGIPFDPLLIGQGDAFDAQKFSWIGSANNEVSVCVAMRDSGITKFEDLFTKELTVGGTGASADTDQFPRVLNATLGTHFKIVEGYPGGNDVLLAMERGEVKGRCGWSWSSVKTTRKEWIDDKRMIVLVQLSLTKHPEMPDVPLVTDFAKTDEERAILKLFFARNVMGRPYLAPPNIPADRLATLRQAFMDTMKDKDFLTEAEKAELEINPVSGEDVEKLVKEVYATPAGIIAKAKAAAATQ